MLPRKTLLPLLAGSVLLAGCDSVTGPRGAVEVRLSQSAQGSHAIAAEMLQSATFEGMEATRIPLSSVASITVTVTRVDAHRAAGADEEETGWISLHLTEEARTLDLLGLPSEENGVTIAAGALSDGRYGKLRLIISGAKITFSEAVTLGGGPHPRTLAAGEHPLTIPSAAQTGIKIPTSFEVSRTQDGENTIVSVVFDGSASVQSLQATPNGVKMSPVLTSRGR